MDRSLPHGRVRRQGYLMLDPAQKGTRDFIFANTGLQTPPHVPEISLHLADEAHDLWHKTEEELATIGLPPPFWAFAGRVAGRCSLYSRSSKGSLRQNCTRLRIRFGSCRHCSNEVGSSRRSGVRHRPLCAACDRNQRGCKQRCHHPDTHRSDRSGSWMGSRACGRRVL